MFLKSLKLPLINFLLISTNIFAHDVETEGELVSGFPEISENPTVKMYLNPKYPPVVNITPGRPTILQFPNEIAICESANNLISFVYSDKKNSSASTSSSNLNDNVESYSAVTITVNPDQIIKLSTSQMLKMSSLVINCKVRISNPDTITNASYAWRIVAVKIVEPKYTHLIVHLLDRPTLKTSRGSQILTDKQIDQLAYIDINKFAKNTVNSDKHKVENKKEPIIKENQLKQVEKKEPIIKEQKSNELNNSILDLYDFKEVKKL